MGDCANWEEGVDEWVKEGNDWEDDVGKSSEGSTKDVIDLGDSEDGEKNSGAGCGSGQGHCKEPCKTNGVDVGNDDWAGGKGWSGKSDWDGGKGWSGKKCGKKCGKKFGKKGAKTWKGKFCGDDHDYDGKGFEGW